MKIAAVWFIGICVAVGIVAAASLVHHTRLGRILRKHIPDTPRRRLLLADIAFIATFLFLRGLTYCIHNNIGPFHNVEMGGRHIHHMVWGILGLLGVGFSWLCEWGTGDAGHSVFLSRLLALLYGAAAALTLDEYALWLNLKDVYWAREGHASIEAGLIFAGLLSAAIFAAPIFKAVHRSGLKALDV